MAENLSDLLERIDFEPDGSFSKIEDAIAVLKFMVSHNTQSSSNPDICKSNAAFMKTLQSALDKIGFKTSYREEEYPANSGISQASLVARMGPATKGGVVLSSHTDVIPAGGTDLARWQTKDPFELTQVDNKLIGRGAVDMKQALTNYLSIAKMYEGKHDLLDKPVYLALTWGEEIGCKGVDTVNEMLSDMGADPDAIIVGEPTDEKLLYGHKGAANVVVKIHAYGGHSSTPDEWMDAGEYEMDLRQSIRSFQSRFMKDEQYHDHNFDPPYPVINVGRVETGSSANTVPGDSTINIHIRSTPLCSLDSIVSELQDMVDEMDAEIKGFAEEFAKASGKEFPSVGVSLEQLSKSKQLYPQKDKALIATMQEIMQDIGLENTEALTASFAADAGGHSRKFPNAATVIFGVGDLNQAAHQPNEYITQEQLSRAPMFALRVIAECCLNEERAKNLHNESPWIVPQSVKSLAIESPTHDI